MWRFTIANYRYLDTSVAEPTLFWAAPAVWGPGADCGSDQIGSAPGKNKPAPAPDTKICHLELL